MPATEQSLRAKAKEPDNTKLVSALYVAYGAGRRADVRAHCTEDVLIHIHGRHRSLFPFMGEWHGMKGFDTFLSLMDTTFHVTDYTNMTINAYGEWVTAINTLQCTYLPTGKTFESTIAHVIRFRDGKVAELHEHIDTDHIIAETGLEAA